MPKDKDSTTVRAVRSLRDGVPVRGLMVLALAAFSAGCYTNQIKDFTPKKGMVCDSVRITGSFHKIGDLDGVWFNGVPARASFRHFPAPKGPLEILAEVPEGASNGPIRIRIAPVEGVIFGGKGLDYTFAKPFSVTGSPPVPAIDSFLANPATIKPGQASTLTWQVSPAVKLLTLDGADVTGTNSQMVSPESTTVYALVAKNDSCLQRSQVLTVTVTPSPETAAATTPTNAPGETPAVNGKEPVPASEPPPPAAPLPAVAASAPAIQSAVPQPAAPAAEPVPVPAPVVSKARGTNAPAVVARKDGAFVDIKSRIGLADQVSGSRQLDVSTNQPGEDQPDLAVFRLDGAKIAQYTFTPGIIGGAAFSPGGDQAVVVTSDPNGFSASYVTEIERFATHYKFQFPVNIMDGFKTATNRWHVLFSPDDTLVMVSTVPVASSGKVAILVHDLVQQKDVGTLIQAGCKTCDLQGEVLNGTAVQVKVDGTVVATLPIK
jgi:hypothetical protein